MGLGAGDAFLGWEGAGTGIFVKIKRAMGLARDEGKLVAEGWEELV